MVMTFELAKLSEGAIFVRENRVMLLLDYSGQVIRSRLRLVIGEHLSLC